MVSSHINIIMVSSSPSRLARMPYLNLQDGPDGEFFFFKKRKNSALIESNNGEIDRLLSRCPENASFPYFEVSHWDFHFLYWDS